MFTGFLFFHVFSSNINHKTLQMATKWKKKKNAGLHPSTVLYVCIFPGYFLLVGKKSRLFFGRVPEAQARWLALGFGHAAELHGLGQEQSQGGDRPPSCSVSFLNAWNWWKEMDQKHPVKHFGKEWGGLFIELIWTYNLRCFSINSFAQVCSYGRNKLRWKAN